IQRPRDCVQRRSGSEVTIQRMDDQRLIKYLRIDYGRFGNGNSAVVGFEFKYCVRVRIYPREAAFDRDPYISVRTWFDQIVGGIQGKCLHGVFPAGADKNKQGIMGTSP